jgi:transcriptional regulator with XRE-family HTH domain
MDLMKGKINLSIRDAAKKSGMTGKQIANAARISYPLYKKILYGGSTMEAAAFRLAAVLGIPPTEIPHKQVRIVRPEVNQ